MALQNPETENAVQGAPKLFKEPQRKPGHPTLDAQIPDEPDAPPSKASEIILLIALVGLTTIKFATEDKLMSLNFFFVVVLAAGYTVSKRFGVLTAFLTLLIVWAFILSDPTAFLAHYDQDTLNYHMTLWSGFLILAGWLGGALSKAIHGSPKPA